MLQNLSEFYLVASKFHYQHIVQHFVNISNELKYTNNVSLPKIYFKYEKHIPIVYILFKVLQIQM